MIQKSIRTGFRVMSYDLGLSRIELERVNGSLELDKSCLKNVEVDRNLPSDTL